MSKSDSPPKGRDRTCAAPASSTARRTRRRFGVAALLVAAACFGVYANALGNPFLMDDTAIVVNDPRVREFKTAELLTGTYWYLGNTDPLYRPLVMLSYAVNWAVSREAWAFRLPNLVVHAGVCVLLLALIQRVFDSCAAALAGALCFALHPLHTETLNTIVGRADVLVGLFMLAALLLYWRDSAPGGSKRRIGPIVAATFYAAALLCKENAVTLIGLIALLDWWRARLGQPADRWRFAVRRIGRCYAPLLVITAGYLALRAHALGGLTGGPETIRWYDNPIAHSATGLARWATPLVTFAKAVRLTLIPDRLCFDYSYAAIETVRRLADPRLWTGLALLAAATAAADISLRRGGRVALALGVWAVTYSIVSNAFVVIGTIFAERLLYLPMMGYSMLIGLLADFALRARRNQPSGTRRAAAVLLCVLLPLLGVWYAHRTVTRNRDWRSTHAVYASAYEVNPRSCKVLSGMADKALSDGDLPQALRYCDQANQVAGDYWPAWRTAGVILWQMALRADDPAEIQRLNDQALRRYEQAIARGAGADPEAMLGAARQHARRGNYHRAIDGLEYLVGYRPLEARAFALLARYLLDAKPVELRDPQRALECVQRAGALRPGVAEYVDTRADALLALGRRGDAVAALREVLGTLPPDSPARAHFRKRLQEIDKE